MRELFTECPRPMIIAHRGACGLLPEQTLAAFELAIEQGADAIELDVVPTSDGILLARHESELSLTTNVAELPHLARYRTTRHIDGAPITGWFTTDLTLAQIRPLRARQRLAFRDHSNDGRWPAPTLDEVLELAAAHTTPVFIEVKQPGHFASLGFAIDELLLATLERHDARRIVLQSFDSSFLRRLRMRTSLPMIQLIETGVFDLDDIATYADGIGPWKRLIVPAPADEDGEFHADHPALLPPTSLVADAHARGLMVSTWTFRNEPQFLAEDYGGDPAREYEHFASLDVDAFTTDFPETARLARNQIANRRSQI
jgi:glycerophosphoryl diester phosphodiesterase